MPMNLKNIKLTNATSQTLSNIRSLTSPLLGVAAGTLCLESTAGFVFYALGTLLVSLLIYLVPAERKPEKYFGAAGAAKRKSRNGTEGMSWGLLSEVAFGGLALDSFMGFVMAWTLVYNLVGT